MVMNRLCASDIMPSREATTIWKRGWELFLKHNHMNLLVERDQNLGDHSKANLK